MWALQRWWEYICCIKKKKTKSPLKILRLHNSQISIAKSLCLTQQWEQKGEWGTHCSLWQIQCKGLELKCKIHPSSSVWSVPVWVINCNPWWRGFPFHTRSNKGLDCHSLNHFNSLDTLAIVKQLIAFHMKK